MTSQTAKQLLAQMEATRAAMALTRCTCAGCQQALRTYEQSGHMIGECVNKACRRVAVTLELSALAKLSNADLDAKKYPDYSVKG